MPSMPNVRTRSASPALPQEPSNRTGVPSRVWCDCTAAGSGACVLLACQRCTAAVASASVASSGAVISSPAVASSTTGSPSRSNRGRSLMPVTVGMPMPRARIAACELMPPSSATIASTFSLSRLNMSAVVSLRTARM